MQTIRMTIHLCVRILWCEPRNQMKLCAPSALQLVRCALPLCYRLRTQPLELLLMPEEYMFITCGVLYTSSWLGRCRAGVPCTRGQAALGAAQQKKPCLPGGCLLDFFWLGHHKGAVGCDIRGCPVSTCVCTVDSSTRAVWQAFRGSCGRNRTK